MSRKEKEKVREFIKKQLRKGYIRPSKSPQTLPVFFVGKKNKKKRIVQDYKYLNKEIIKNNYSLSLISDLNDIMDMRKVFTKINLQWKYKIVGPSYKGNFTVSQRQWINGLDKAHIPVQDLISISSGLVTSFSLSAPCYQSIMTSLYRGTIATS